jgi:hypothetical protein
VPFDNICIFPAFCHYGKITTKSVISIIQLFSYTGQMEMQEFYWSKSDVLVMKLELFTEDSDCDESDNDHN